MVPLKLRYTPRVSGWGIVGALLCVLLLACAYVTWHSVRIPILIGELKSSNTVNRARAAMALSKIGTPAVEPLIAVLNAHGSGQREAARALGEIKDSRAVEPLMAAMKDTDWVVRERAANALGEIKDQRAVEPLIAAMKETHPAVRGAVGNALCELDSPRTIELLKTALNSADADSRRNMVETLSSCGKPDFEDLLIETLNRFNEKNLAQVFINSKHPKLEDAARKWAASYGYQIFCDGCIDTDK